MRRRMSPEPQNQANPFDYFDLFLVTLEGSSYASCKSSLNGFRRFIASAGKDPRHLVKEDVEAWKEHLDRDHKPASVNRKLVALSAFYRWYCAQTGCKSIVDGVRRHPNQPVNKRKSFTAEQVEAILLATSDCKTYKDYRDRAILHVLLRTGLSNSQVRSLKVEDLVYEHDHAILRVRSGNGEVLIPLSQEMTGYITDYLKQRRARHKYLPDSPLFSNVLNRGDVKPNGKMDSTTLTTSIQRILKKAGVNGELKEYSFPLTAMRFAIEGGASLKEIHELSVLLRIPKRFFLELEEDMRSLSPYDSVSRGVEQAEAEARRGVIKCSDLRHVLEAFSDNDLLEIRIGDEGDLRIVSIMKVSRISYGLIR